VFKKKHSLARAGIRVPVTIENNLDRAVTSACARLAFTAMESTVTGITSNPAQSASI
jgi:hypothetical protein